MKKVLKRSLLVLVLLMTLCLFGAIGCSCSSKSDLTVKVTYPDGKAVEAEAVEIQICVKLANGTYGSCYDETKKTDSKGVVKFNIADVKAAFEDVAMKTDTYKIQINVAPEGYKTHATDENYVAGEVDISKSQSITIKLEAIS